MTRSTIWTYLADGAVVAGLALILVGPTAVTATVSPSQTLLPVATVVQALLPTAASATDSRVISDNTHVVACCDGSCALIAGNDDPHGWFAGNDDPHGLFAANDDPHALFAGNDDPHALFAGNDDPHALFAGNDDPHALFAGNDDPHALFAGNDDPHGAFAG